MKKSILLFVFSFFALILPAQQNLTKYYQLTKDAKTALDNKDYRKSAFLYREAFKSNNWKAYSDDRYNAACANSEAGYKDSALFQLFKMIELYNYSDYAALVAEPHFQTLRADVKWEEVLKKVKQNIINGSQLNKTLVMLLDSVYRVDQGCRLNSVAAINQYGAGSAEAKEMLKAIHQKDSVNLMIVTNIIDRYGWVGKHVVGALGNSTLCEVLLHADQKTQEKYLPLMREAVKKGNADVADLAQLEDIVSLKQRKKQIYGTQIKPVGNKKYCILPIENPEKLEETRKNAGLNTMNQYLVNWNMTWNINNYNKDLLLLEEKKIEY